ncbi:sensor histidine kinase [Variovorax terrae]|uniref:histidine kinase n=1 Tax=Variovorax terrae TaxID=2923278 RepID=A0A9X1VTJ8_9BURK|nr:sensor histidine kinase [Variovorax terrae]MCJ0762879.1 sensor histidine kinase [Variovorax terrae]
MNPAGSASLLRKLLYPLLWLWLLPALLAMLAAFWLAGRTAQSSFDRILKDDALALGAQVRWDAEGPRFAVDSRTAASLVFDSLSPSRFTVRTGDGRTLVGNAELSLPQGSDQQPTGHPLFYDTPTTWGSLRAVAVRLEQAGRPESVWVIVGEAQSKRDQISRELALAIFLPAAGLGFLIIPLLFLGIRYGLAPARDTTLAVARRGIDDLSPLPLDNVPDELRGLIGHINDLLARLQEAVAHERRFIADAAHQLRTPVAGLKLLADDLQRTHHANPGQPPDSEVLDELHAAASRATHLVRQLLALARSERGTPAETTRFELCALLQEVAGRWQEPAAAAHKTLQADADLARLGPLWLSGSPILLEEALGNVIDNALLYGGPVVRISLEPAGDELLVHVQDNGPAIAPAVRDQMLTPFWRGDQASASGSGLGLPIAQKAVRGLGGELLIGSGPQGTGTRVTFRLPHQRTGRHTTEAAPASK